MPSSNEGGPDVFFDSVDCLPSEQPLLAKVELGYDKFEYDIWMNEPQSVNERREGFLRRMDLTDFSSSSKDCSKQREVKMTKGPPERLAVRTRLVSRTLTDSSDSATESSVNCSGKTALEAKILSDEPRRRREDKADVASRAEVHEPSSYSLEYRHRDAELREQCRNFHMSEKKMKKWFKHLLSKNNKCSPGMVKSVLARPKVTNQIKVKRHKKRWMEFTGVYTGQEIRAHKGLIWTMKFSPDGQYLASGGEDGVVRLWRVTSWDTSYNFSSAVYKRVHYVKDNLFSSLRKASNHSSILLPKKVFYIEETPIQEFYGHSSGILDLAWSHSKLLLSSSKDKTVRLWQVGYDPCLKVFRHKDYVTCVQFNPVDENHFISGSLDGKVRIWRVSEKRVVDWADIGDGITAICYQPNGNGFVVGSLTGSCRHFAASGKQIQLEGQIYVQGKKKMVGTRVTGIQFSGEKFQRAMVASEDSKIRVFDGTNIHCKYKGLPKSGSQTSASWTSTGKHIVSVGEDSRVYIWNLGDFDCSSRKKEKSVHSCEYFFCEGSTVALPWSCMSKERIHHQGHWIRDSERFPLSNSFSMDGRGSMTWPEEKLPIYDTERRDEDHPQKQHLHSDIYDWTSLCETWGLVIVTADSNGTIKTFHNFGFPIRL